MIWKVLYVSLLICSISFLSCSSVTSESGKNIVDKSIKAHGGYRTFNTLKAVSFNKTTRLYNEDGSIESETIQEQSFRLTPDYFSVIKWNDGSMEHQINYDRRIVVKRVNNKIVEDHDALENALKLALSAEYVFFQPFKLMDHNSELSYEGKLMIRDSIETSVVAIKYENDRPSSDAWRYYFDENYRLVAASVKHNNRISLIENLEFQTYKGVLFNKSRKSYFVDSIFQKKQLRAEYHYEIVDPNE